MSGKLSVSLHLAQRRLFFSQVKVSIQPCPGDAHGGGMARERAGPTGRSRELSPGNVCGKRAQVQELPLTGLRAFGLGLAA